MEIIKKSVFALVLLLIVVIAWIVSSIYFQRTFIDINPNAESYTGSIKETFDLEVLEEISERTKNSYPTSPQEFFRLRENL